MAIIDAARIKAFHTQHPDLVEELVELFATTTPPLIDELTQAAADGDRDLVRYVAHQLQGGSRSIGADVLADMAREIETGQGASPHQLDALTRAFEETRIALARAID